MAHSQDLTVNDFISFTSFPYQKFSDYVSKKGFIAVSIISRNDTIVYTYDNYNYRKHTAADSIQRNVVMYTYNRGWSFLYETASAEEYARIETELKAKGFLYTNKPGVSDLLFQKNDLAVHVSQRKADTSQLYDFIIEKRILPALKDIHFAEDLLSFNSHENLEYVFGKSNVKKDIYYFSEKEVNKCSVLYPNTSRQVIFIWDDQDNNYKLSYLLFGGSLQTKSAITNAPVITESSWTLANGLKPGMNLAELTQMNGGDISFFGKRSEFEGMIVPGNKGELNFRQAGVLLSCLNCDNSALLDKQVVSANEAIEQNKKIFVLSIILSPEAHASR